jgi:hypothetical protein
LLLLFLIDFSAASQPSRPTDYYIYDIEDIIYWFQIVGGILILVFAVVFYFYIRLFRAFNSRVENRLSDFRQMNNQKSTDVKDVHLNILNNCYANNERITSTTATFQIGKNKSDNNYSFSAERVSDNSTMLYYFHLYK